jgi:hypothetical protein
VNAEQVRLRKWKMFGISGYGPETPGAARAEKSPDLSPRASIIKTRRLDGRNKKILNKNSTQTVKKDLGI